MFQRLNFYYSYPISTKNCHSLHEINQKLFAIDIRYKFLEFISLNFFFTRILEK